MRTLHCRFRAKRERACVYSRIGRAVRGGGTCRRSSGVVLSTAAFAVSVTVQALIKVSQSIAERDESNQQSPTQSAIVEAKLRSSRRWLRLGYDRNRTNPPSSPIHIARKNFSLSFQRQILPLLPRIRLTPLSLNFKISFPFRRCTRKENTGFFPPSPVDLQWDCLVHVQRDRGIVFVE